MKMTFRDSQNRGFTLIELLIVIAILGTLGGIAYPTYMSIQTNASKTAARKVCTDIVEACTRFGQDNNGSMPYDFNEAKADNRDQIFLTTEDGKDAKLVTILTNREEGDDRINSTRSTYMESNEQDERRDGLYVESSGGVSLYDPWGRPYYVVICEEDQGCYDPFVRKKRYRGKKCLVYSTGPDATGVGSGHAKGKGSLDGEEAVLDNVYSWKKEK